MKIGLVRHFSAAMRSLAFAAQVIREPDTSVD